MRASGDNRSVRGSQGAGVSGLAIGGKTGWAPWLLGGPALLWLLVLVVAPMAGLWLVSFLSQGDYGQFGLPFTVENYRRLAGWSELGYDAAYPRVFVRTVLLAGGVTLLCASFGLVLAFFLARLGPRTRPVALALVVVPFWTNLLVRTYAWQVLLGADGPVAGWASAWGWMAPGTGLYPGWFAVTAAMVADFLPFMVLPVYASVEKLDWTLAEAAADLGAGPRKVFRHAVLPQIAPGLRAGSLMVFLPALGQFVIPDLLGGGRVTLWGNLVQQQFGSSRDWPLGAAAAVAMMLMLVFWMGWRRRRDSVVSEGPHL